jgi:D-glycero-D-manno-heptose 1,7-bisphosphate phosphatase
MSNKKAVFFDRDDTLIYDVPYNGDPDRVELMPGALEACRLLKQNGFELFIISNQSGVGRGRITAEQVNVVNERVLQLFGEHLFTDIYCCYDTPEDPLDCRKPSPKMILQAAERYDIDLSQSFMVGDKKSDIDAGRNAGCRSILFLPTKTPTYMPSGEAAFYSSHDMHEIADKIINTK